MINCEFCDEVKDFQSSRVGKIYSDIDTRIIQESENFCVIPTIGQLIAPMFMVISKDHYDSFAEIPKELLPECLQLLKEVENDLGRRTILFEHGAKKTTGMACGVYHAHMHIVTIESDFKYDELTGADALCYDSLAEALSYVKDSENYILYRDNDGAFYVNNPSKPDSDVFNSQYFRRWLVSKYKLDKDWNWRNYNDIENELISIKQDGI